MSPSKQYNLFFVRTSVYMDVLPKYKRHVKTCLELAQINYSLRVLVCQSWGGVCYEE